MLLRPLLMPTTATALARTHNTGLVMYQSLQHEPSERCTVSCPPITVVSSLVTHDILKSKQLLLADARLLPRCYGLEPYD
jgi:hypothetical protein